MNKKALVPALGITMLAGMISTPSVFAENKTTGVSLDVEEKMTLTLDKDALNFTALDSGLQIDALKLSVLTNAANGYTVSFNANNDYNDLKHSNAAITEKIPSITEQKTADTFTETAWAYSLDTENHTFNQIPIVPQNIFTATTKGQNAYDFSIGVRVKDALAAGDYENELIFTAVANPIPVTFSNIHTMQQMTPEVCATASENESNQLIDSRDGKTYWVTKLADGNCWMTQNLDYDLDPSVALTPADSDVTTNWTPARATIHGIENLNATSWPITGMFLNTIMANDYHTAYSFDPGTYYNDGEYTDAAFCDYTTTECEHYATTPYELNGEHGHLGNYYNWPAAVASDNTSAIRIESDAETSICPKGWRLPHGEKSPQGNDFTSLNNAYGGATDSDVALLSSPSFFIRGSSVGKFPVGLSTVANSGGVYWSSTVDSDKNANNILLDRTSISSNASGYYYGYQVRCIARKNSKAVTIKDSIDNLTLSSHNFESAFKLQVVQKENYNFLGYSEDKSATTPTYVAGDVITDSKNLYAIYSPKTSPENVTLVMQDIANWKDTLSVGQQVQAKDTRDGKVYWVAKLKDGNVWMTQNLDLDLNENITLTPEDTNITSNWTPARSTIKQNTPFDWTNDYNTPYSVDSGNYYFDGTYYSSSACNFMTTTCPHYSTTPYELNGEHGHIGNYYNWSAVVASNDTSAITTETEMTTSICPKGWRLPTSGSATANYSFGNLVKQYGYTGSSQSASDATLLASPLFFARGGYVYSSSLYDQGSYGCYWSSRSNSSSSSAYDLNFYSSNVNPSNNYHRSNGLSVRCVAL